MESRKLLLAVQRGPSWLPTPSSLRALISQFGEVEGEVQYDSGRGRGAFVMAERGAADMLAYRSLAMPELEGEVVSLFVWRSFSELEEVGGSAVAGLLLLESPWLPTGWSCRAQLRSYFEQYCQVRGGFSSSCLSSFISQKAILVSCPSLHWDRCSANKQTRCSRAVLQTLTTN